MLLKQKSIRRKEIAVDYRYNCKHFMTRLTFLVNKKCNEASLGFYVLKIRQKNVVLVVVLESNK